MTSPARPARRLPTGRVAILSLLTLLLPIIGCESDPFLLGDLAFAVAPPKAGTLFGDETPTVTGPPDLTVECDGNGNAADLADWLNQVAYTVGCGTATLRRDHLTRAGCEGTSTLHITWTVIDACNQTAVYSAAFTIVDSTPPTLTLLGPAEMTLSLGTPFSDPGVAVIDRCDKLITPAVSGSVETNRVGDYTLTYAAHDACGNPAKPLQRLIHVVEGGSPAAAAAAPAAYVPK